MASQLVITNETTHVKVLHGTGVADRYPYNSLAIIRRGNNFQLMNGGDNRTPMARFNFSDVVTVAGVAPADADALETALAAILFQ